jgi:peptidoglycan/LPS O-acetylase OafA/YrhL
LPFDLTFQARAAKSSAYRADIDGLRAIAVLAVVCFHANVVHVTGGFVGVDIFFVISGYLITQVIDAEMEQGRFTFRGFYERRMRRIFPALFAVALFCALAGAALFPPLRFAEFGQSLLAMTGFVSNIYFQRTAPIQGYFGDTSGTQLLLHTWTLALEEQFYLLFPVLLLLLNKFARPLRGVVVLVLLLVSFRSGVQGLQSNLLADHVTVFYLLPGRAWELLLGALLAFGVLPPVRNVIVRSLTGAAGLAAIVYAIATFTGDTPFPGYNALYPCLGAALLIYSGAGGRSPVKSALSLPPLVFIGVISYSLYLWHWPLIVITKFFTAQFITAPQSLIVPLVLSVVLAFLSFEFIESPFRRSSSGKASGNSSQGRALWVGIAASLALSGLALAVMLSKGVPARYGAAKSALLDRNYAEKSQVVRIDECSNYRTELKHYEDARFCEVGPAARNILVWGDSHAAQVYPLLNDLRSEGRLDGHGLVYAIAAACPTAQTINLYSLTGFHCNTFARYTMMRAAKDDVDTVFIIFSPWWTLQPGDTCLVANGVCAKTLNGPEAWQQFLLETGGTIRALRKNGRRVIVSLPFPVYSMLIPDYQIRFIDFYLHPQLQKLFPNPIQLIPEQYSVDLRAVASAAGAIVYDPRQTLCHDGHCTYAIDGVSLYSDQSHLATSQLGVVRPGILKALQTPSPAPASGQTGTP